MSPAFPHRSTLAVAIAAILLFFFNGAYSHAILKVPAAGEFRSQEERGAAMQSRSCASAAPRTGSPCTVTKNDLS